MSMMEDVYPSRVKSEPSFLPRKDPVAYSQWTSDAPLSREQHEAYVRDGFLFLENLLSADEVAALQAESDALRSPGVDLDDETVFTEKGSGEVRSIFRIHAQNDVMARLSADARLAGVANYLLGDEVYIHQSRLNYKPGFRGKEFYWHSDFETWHVEDGMPRMRALSMSVLLTDNHAHNGPLMLVPGSQNSYVTCIGKTPDDHYKESLRKQEYGVPDEDSLSCLVEQGGLAAPTGKAGSVLIFDCNTMHGSASNISPFPRSNAFFVYNAVSNRLVAPFGPAKPRPEFVAAREDVTPVRPVSGPVTAMAA